MGNPATKGRVERCSIWGNHLGGVWAQQQGDPTVVGCVIRDHTWGDWAFGIHVDFSSHRLATIGVDCVFARNVSGDLVREEPEPNLEAAPAQEE